MVTSDRKNWRILQWNTSEIGTTNALQCQFPVWRHHTIGPRTAKKGDIYCTALKRNMGRSAWGNLVQWVNLQNRMKSGSPYSHNPSYVISPAVAGCGSRSCTDNASNFVPDSPVFSILQFFLIMYSFFVCVLSPHSSRVCIGIISLSFFPSWVLKNQPNH